MDFYLAKLVILIVSLLLTITACTKNLLDQVVGPTPISHNVTPGSSVTAPIGTSISNTSASTPLKIHFVMAKAPKLNESVSLTVTVKSVLDAPNTTAELEIPDSATLVSGTLNFQGDLRKDEIAQFEAVIKFTEEGNSTIRAVVTRVVSQDEIWGDVAYMYLNIGIESSQFGFEGTDFPPTPDSEVSPPPGISPVPP